MKAVELRAEVYLMAIQSLSKAEKEAVIARLLEGPQLREDILDLAVILQRQGEALTTFQGILGLEGKYYRPLGACLAGVPKGMKSFT
jgi:hypothetical protein